MPVERNIGRGDATATESTIDGFIDTMVAALRPVIISDCTNRKLVAAGRKGRQKLECHGDAANVGGPVAPACLAEAEEDSTTPS